MPASWPHGVFRVFTCFHQFGPDCFRAARGGDVVHGWHGLTYTHRHGCAFQWGDTQLTNRFCTILRAYTCIFTPPQLQFRTRFTRTKSPRRVSGRTPGGAGVGTDFSLAPHVVWHRGDLWGPGSIAGERAGVRRSDPGDLDGRDGRCPVVTW